VREVIVVPFPSPLLSRASDSSVRALLIQQRSAGASAFCYVTNLFRDDAMFVDSSRCCCCSRFETREVFCFLRFAGY
jgi:hypothetical protein